MGSLFARLTVGALLMLLLLGGIIMWVTHRSQNLHFLELNQQLHSPVAMYIAQNTTIVNNGSIDTAVLTDLADHIMMLNPSVEVYALDSTGTILGSSHSQLPVALPNVDVQPIRDYLSPGRQLPLMGDNPIDAQSHSIFSAFPLHIDPADNTSTLLGYVYVVLASQKQLSLQDAVRARTSSRSMVLTLLSVLALTAVAAITLFFLLTARLRKLQREVVAEHQHLMHAATADLQQPDKPDEIDQLAHAYSRMTSQLADQNRQLLRADASRRELFASISHDLRTPLTTLQSYLETLVTHGKRFDEQKTQRYLNTAHNHTQRLKSLVTDLFELTRLDSGDMQPRLEAFSLLELVHDVVQDYQPFAQEKRIRLHVDCKDTAINRLMVNADIAMLQRVFTNLMSNALKHTQANDSIIIAVRHLSASSIEVVFSDTGSGMPAEQHARLVADGCTAQPQSIRPNWKTDYSANGGLGLQIVRRILNLHNSELQIDSAPGQGTRMQFRLSALVTARRSADLVLS